MRRPLLDCAAQCPPGVEPITAAELAAVGVSVTGRSAGLVAFRARPRQLYAVNLWSRTATRVLVRIASFRAETIAELDRGAAAAPWERYLGPGQGIALRVSSSASRLYHTGLIEERIAAAARAAAGDPVLVVAHVHHDRVTISVDASGAPLYQRGWRQRGGRAPLRENLAAALLVASGYDGADPLVDPLCGSGTIAVEAALLGRDRPPGGGRSFAFERWPSFEPGTWASVRAEAAARERPAAGVAIVGSDRDAGAVDAARANAERAGVAGDVAFHRRALAAVTAPGGRPGFVVANPPYGARVTGGRDLRDLYAALGKRLREGFAGWHVGLLVADPVLAGHTGLVLTERLRTGNGGIPVRVMAGTVP